MNSDKIEFLIGTGSNVDFRSGGNIDFRREVYMSDETFNDFISKLRLSFFPVTSFNVEEFVKRKRVGDKGKKRRIFHKEEYEFLLKSKNENEAYKKLGMPKFIVIQRTGEIISNFFNWCEKNKEDVSIMTDPQSKFAEIFEERGEMSRGYSKFTEKDRSILKRRLRQVVKIMSTTNDESIRKESGRKKEEIIKEYKVIKNNLEKIRIGEIIFRDGQITISK